MGVFGLFRGLGALLEKIGEMAEKGQELRKSGEIHTSAGGRDVRGVYGFTIRTCTGDGDEGVTIEPFGNVRRDEESGKTVVHEVREPLVDVFEEDDYVLVVAEMPGIGEEDVQLELKDDILAVTATKGEQKYRKEVLLPASFSPDKMSHTCRNGVLEVKLVR